MSARYNYKIFGLSYQKKKKSFISWHGEDKGRGSFGGEDQGFGLRHIRLEMPIRCPSGAIKEEPGDENLEFRGRITSWRYIFESHQDTDGI